MRGTALLSAPESFSRRMVILLGHLHLDHLLGLGMLPRMSEPGKRTEVYVPAGSGGSAAQVLDRVYSPPFWPCKLTEYAGELSLYALSFPLRFNGFTVRETVRYAALETYLTTALGIALGLAGGALAGHHITLLIEKPFLQYVRDPDWRSFVFSALITAVLALGINAYALRQVRTLNLSDAV